MQERRRRLRDLARRGVKSFAARAKRQRDVHVILI